MKYKNRVLHIMGALNAGGQETLIMNIYRKINEKDFQFDFSVVSKDKGIYEKEIENRGGNIYHIISSGEDRIKYFKQMYNLLKKYDIIHIHTSSAKVIFLVWLAKLAKCKKIIVHSHNTSCDGVKIHKITRRLLKHTNIIRIACSEEAGRWMFGNKKFLILHNGIEVLKYKFNESVRENKRNELNINKNEFVIGNIGRMEIQKNHERLIDIFYEISHKVNNAKLLIIGNGTLEDKIKEDIKIKKLEDKVILLNNRNDIHELLQAMDVFVMTSKYEGLAVSMIEAQASGLHIIASDRISKQVDITQLVQFLSLDSNNGTWTDSICRYDNKKVNREKYNQVVFNSDYNIKNTVNEILKVYET